MNGQIIDRIWNRQIDLEIDRWIDLQIVGRQVRIKTGGQIGR